MTVLSLALAVLVLAGCNPPDLAVTASAPPAPVETVDLEGLNEAVEAAHHHAAEIRYIEHVAAVERLNEAIAAQERQEADERAAAAEAARQAAAARPARQIAAGGCRGWGDVIAAHFPAHQIGNACAVMSCESRGNPNAVSPTNDHGLMQIHAGSSSWPEGHKSAFQQVTGRPFYPGVYDPEANMAYAAHLWRAQGWAPWSCARKVL